MTCWIMSVSVFVFPCPRASLIGISLRAHQTSLWEGIGTDKDRELHIPAAECEPLNWRGSPHFATE